MPKPFLIQHMQSDLERTNSWLPFLEGLEESLRTKDFRVATVRSIFRFVDPQFDTQFIGLKLYLQYLVFWHTTQRGRKCRYIVPFTLFCSQKKAVFQDAPGIVVETYNRYLKELLGESSEQFLIPAEWARQHKTKRELILERGKRAAESFQAYMEKLGRRQEPEKNLQVPSYKEKTDVIFREQEKPVLASTLHDQSENESRLLRDWYDKKQKLLDRLFLLPKGYPGKEQLVREIRSQELKSETSLDLFDESVTKMWQEYSNVTLNEFGRLSTLYTKAAFQLWPCISSELVWVDMKDELFSIQPSLTILLQEFFKKKQPQNVLEYIFSKMVLEDDVRAFLGEVVHRFHRQKDLVQAYRQRVYECIQLLTFAAIANGSLVPDLQGLLRKLINGIVVCLLPHQVQSKEDVARFFRDCWVALENMSIDIDRYKALLLEVCTEERLKEYVRAIKQVLIYWNNGNRGSKVFHSMPITSLNDLFTWQQEHLRDILCGLLLFDRSAEEKKRALAHIAAYNERAKSHKRLKQACVEAVVVGVPFLEWILLSTDVLFECEFIRAVLDEKMTSFSESNLCSRCESAIKAWWLTIPEEFKVTDQERLKKVELDPLWRDESPATVVQELLAKRSLNDHGASLRVLNALSFVIAEWHSKNDFGALYHALQLASLACDAWQELFFQGQVSLKSLRAIKEALVQDKEPSLVVEKAKLFCALDSDTQKIPFSLPMIGNLESLY